MAIFFKQNKLFKFSALCFLILWLSIFLFEKINLCTADLGRLLKNGEVIFQGDFKILKTNFYSYTHPDFYFLNHHWGGGVVFFLVWKISGFWGLHLFYILLTLATFLIFFSIAQKEGGFWTAFVVSLLVIPLIAQRREIRPEIFTYLFSAIFFWILWHYKQKLISYKYLFLLPFLEILWVNTHLFCFLGPALIGAFLFEEIFFVSKKEKQTIKALCAILIFTIAAISINPSGLKQFIWPLQVVKNHEYRLIEDQSVVFLEKLGFIKNPNFFLFKMVFLLLILSFIFVFLVNRKKFSVANCFLGVSFGILAFLAIRNFTIFAFFALPIIASNIKNVLPKNVESESILCIGLIVFIITLFTHYNHLFVAGGRFGLGLMPKINESAAFFLENDIDGTVFNNYDIGSYLIFHLYPEYRVFVDNRPEGYPGLFFNQTYIPLQEDEEFWNKKQKEYQFNAIFFYRHDATPWAQPFLIRRIKDPGWAPVFVDDYAIILLKRNQLNQEIIKEYEIPKEYFKI